MKTFKENGGIIPTKTLPFPLVNRRRISPKLSNTPNIVSIICICPLPSQKFQDQNTVKHVYIDHAYNEMTLITKH